MTYTNEEYTRARKYWKYLTMKELREFYNADMQNPYKSHMRDYTFEEWVISSAKQSAYEIAHDI
jgi:chromosomal replication initiation ATPase DnaA